MSLLHHAMQKAFNTYCGKYKEKLVILQTIGIVVIKSKETRDLHMLLMYLDQNQSAYHQPVQKIMYIPLNKG